MLERLKQWWQNDTGSGFSSHTTTLVKIGLSMAAAAMIIGGLVLAADQLQVKVADQIKNSVP